MNMRQNVYHIRCAPIAIAAMAALFSTTAIAQAAAPQAPVIVLPEPEPTMAPAPAIEVPATRVPTMAPATVAPAPEAAAAEAAIPAEESPATAAATEAGATASRASRRAVAPAASAAPAGNDALPVEFAAEDDVGDIAPVAAAPVERPSAIGAVPIEDNSSEALLLGLLAALVIFGAGFLALRSRRGPIAGPPIERPVVRARPTYAPSSPLIEREPRVSSFDEPAYAVPAFGAAAGSGAVPLPRELPRTFEERDSLLKRMIAARPDRANPFRSRPARAKRARLILQSLGRKFEQGKPRIDLSQYTEIWPALRGWRPATA